MKPFRLFTPAILILLPVLLSFVIWAVPGESLRLRGFDSRSIPEAGGVALLAAWYILLIFIAMLGVRVGKGIRPLRAVRLIETDPKFDVRVYLLISFTALVGVVGTYLLVAGEYSVVDMILAGRTNELSEQLQSGTSVATLRYATVLAAPIGLLLWSRLPRSIPLALLAGANLALLGLNALLSSRLSVLMASVVFVYLFLRDRPKARLRILPTLGAGAAISLVLVAFSYVRTAGFYRNLGVTSPIEVAFYQFASYLGAPAQTSIGVSNAAMSGRFPVLGDPLSAIIRLSPTFLQFGAAKGDRSRIVGPEEYGYQVNLAGNLNANSVFADVYSSLGWWGLMAILAGIFAAAVLMGHGSRYTSVLAAGSGVMAYVLLEVWRAYLLNTGMVIFLIALLGVAAIIYAVISEVQHHRLQVRQ
jgi:oligosaccharide repeat unit polymerase